MNIFVIITVIGAAVCMVLCDDKNDKHSNDALSNIDGAISKDDDDAKIEKLCESGDTRCVRDFFDSNAECTKVQDPIAEPLHISTLYSYVPVMNATFVLKDTSLTNVDGTLEKFYINNNTGNLVMSVKFEGVSLEAEELQFYVNRKGKEPKLAKDKASGIYPSTITAIIPAKERITPAILKKYSVSGYVPPSVDFFIGPKIIENKDPVIAAAVKSLGANLPTVIQELFLTGAPDFFLAYLQRNICDFGIPLENAFEL